MTPRQEIALMPSQAHAMASGAPVHGDHSGLVRCSQFPEWKENRMQSLALPANAAADVKSYAALGFMGCCRTPIATQPSPLADDIFQRPLPMWRTTDLELESSILMLPISMILCSLDNHRRLVPEAVRMARIRKGLERAAREDAVIHFALWLGDLGRSENLFRTVEDVLFDVAEARTRGELRVATVEELRQAYDEETGDSAPRRAA